MGLMTRLHDTKQKAGADRARWRSYSSQCCKQKLGRRTCLELAEIAVLQGIGDQLPYNTGDARWLSASIWNMDYGKPPVNQRG